MRKFALTQPLKPKAAQPKLTRLGFLVLLLGADFVGGSLVLVEHLHALPRQRASWEQLGRHHLAGT